MTLFVVFLFVTFPIISNGLQFSKSQTTIHCGRDTIPGQVPFYASIDVDGAPRSFLKCSGVLIANRWVLTAAYCTFNFFKPIRVVLGDEWNNKTIEVEKSYVHPDFKRRTEENDIALLLLKEPVQFSRNIQPICLPEPGEDETFYGRHGTVAGWGKLDSQKRELPTNMQITSLPIIREDNCWESYIKAGFEKRNNVEPFMCAGYSKDLKDVCFSGPGNPFMVNVKKHWVLAGIAMNNIHCERPVLPEVYLNVASYLDWIKRTVY
ncbi:vitamin K-dependent protein C-like [Tetranychus urticae]|uniref:Peptidase S1 domain-containing protein n=1 Tax=Tetranychus urticae TaxID=32264 RepID=T1L3I2_TETUR|nr:vitamin K-dependent protein C-like [Tetranychus urticae]